MTVVIKMANVIDDLRMGLQASIHQMLLLFFPLSIIISSFSVVTLTRYLHCCDIGIIFSWLSEDLNIEMLLCGAVIR